MSLLLIAIAVLLLLILIAQLRTHVLLEAQASLLQQQREHDVFFAIKDRPHWQDARRIHLWASERGWTLEQAYAYMREKDLSENIQRTMNEGKHMAN